MPTNDTMVFDIHAHPSLKGFVFGDDLTVSHPHPAKDLNTLDAQIDLPDMQSGNVRLMMCAHYLIEKDFVGHWSPTIRILSDVYQWLKSKNVVEDPGTPGKPLEQLLGILHYFEEAIALANTKGYPCTIAKNLMELRLGLAQGKTVFLHGMEGTNCFNNLPATTSVPNAVERLKAAGIMQVTLAHLVDSELVPSQQMIPPGTKRELGYTGPNPNPAALLGTSGQLLVQELMDNGILIDLQHCTPATRKQIYVLNQARGDNKVPLLFTHTGLRSLALTGTMGHVKNGTYTYKYDLDNLPDDDEVKEIILSGGIIGVIFANYWLCGTEEDSIFHTDNGIPWVVKTIRAIQRIEQSVTGSAECQHICIGSDMDGFTQRPDDLTSPSNMPDLLHALEHAGFSKLQIENIAWRNYLRVLELGWK